MDNIIKLSNEDLIEISTCVWLELIHLKFLQYYASDPNLVNSSEKNFKNLFRAYTNLNDFPSKKIEEKTIEEIEKRARERLKFENINPNNNIPYPIN